MTFYELLYEAQFHGSNRLMERKCRFFWILALAMFLCIAASIVTMTLMRFLGNPAFMAVADTQQMAMKFPAVGIFPEVNYPEDKVDKFLAEIYYPPGLNSSDLKPVIGQLAAFYRPGLPYTLNDLKMIERVLDYNTLTVETAARRLTATCEEILLRAIINSGSHKQNFAIYTSKTGPLASLVSVISNSQKIGDIASSYKWVILESGMQFVETVGNGTPISPNSEMWIGYDTKQYVITEDANLKPGLRTCRLSSTKLKYFPTYSKRYCMLECEMARTIKHCQCVKTNHPQITDMPYCRARSLLCVKNSAVTAAMCDCRPTFDSALDLISVQNFPLLNSDSHAIDQLYQGLNMSTVSVVRTYVVNHERKLHSRRSFYTAEHLFSQIGGVFSIFFGCSVLTLLEVIQLAWHGFQEYRAVKALNRKAELILPPIDNKKKKANTSQTVNKKKKLLREW